MSDYPRILSDSIVFQGWGTIRSYEVQTRPGGAPARREVYDHGSAAAILLFDPARGTVLLVRQLRVPVLLAGDGAGHIEVCAGLLEGKSPADCATAEAIEETGHRPRSLAHAFDAWVSPGSLTEKVHCFIGEYDETTREGDGGGLEDEGEEIDILELGFETAFDMIAQGTIIDAKTIMLLQHLKLSGRVG